MKEPVDHILRPRLPWRSPDAPAITECGYDAAKVGTLSREDYFQRLNDYGQQRTAMTVCMTCANTARQWGTWDDDPRLAVQREISWETPYHYGRQSNKHGQQLKDELLAIAELIAAHREEFDSLVDAIQKRREWLGKKEELKRKVIPKSPKMPSL